MQKANTIVMDVAKMKRLVLKTTYILIRCCFTKKRFLVETS